MSFINKGELTAAIHSGRLTLRVEAERCGMMSGAAVILAEKGVEEVETSFLRRAKLCVALLLEEAAQGTEWQVMIQPNRVFLTSRLGVVCDTDTMDMARQVISDVSSSVVWCRDVEGVPSMIVRVEADDVIVKQKQEGKAWEAVDDAYALRILCIAFCETLDAVGDMTQALESRKLSRT